MSETKHTPGPWTASADHLITVGTCLLGWQIWGAKRICLTERQNVGLEQEAANARLIAAAPDHAIVARLLIQGKARWEPYTSEFCLNGMRYSTSLDEFGVPVLHSVLRSAIARAEERS